MQWTTEGKALDPSARALKTSLTHEACLSHGSSDQVPRRIVRRSVPFIMYHALTASPTSDQTGENGVRRDLARSSLKAEPPSRRPIYCLQRLMSSRDIVRPAPNRRSHGQLHRRCVKIPVRERRLDQLPTAR